MKKGLILVYMLFINTGLNTIYSQTYNGYTLSYSDHTKTSYDGTYEFKYLRPVDYHVFVYSKDSTLQTNALIPVIKDVTISKKHQEVEVPVMIVYE